MVGEDAVQGCELCVDPVDHGLQLGLGLPIVQEQAEDDLCGIDAAYSDASHGLAVYEMLDALIGQSEHLREQPRGTILRDVQLVRGAHQRAQKLHPQWSLCHAGRRVDDLRYVKPAVVPDHFGHHRMERRRMPQAISMAQNVLSPRGGGGSRGRRRRSSEGRSLLAPSQYHGAPHPRGG